MPKVRGEWRKGVGLVASPDPGGADGLFQLLRLLRLDAGGGGWRVAPEPEERAVISLTVF